VDIKMNNKYDLKVLITLVIFSLFLQVPVQFAFAQGHVHQKSGAAVNSGNNNLVTYENVVHGIKILYPDGWQKTEQISANRFWVNFVSPFNSNNASAFPATVSVSVESLNQNISTNATTHYVNGVLASVKKSLPDFQIIESSPKSSIAGDSAYKIVYTFLSLDPAVQAHFQSMNIWTVKDKKAYSISYTELKPLYAAYLPTVQKMIDSLEIMAK
jgi:eukaryotic-like serine/threonine-protein kinase